MQHPLSYHDRLEACAVLRHHAIRWSNANSWPGCA